jgi:hypothetical protein
MKQLKKITWGILLLVTVFVACKKKSKNENEIAPKSAFDGDYILKQIQVAGQPLPEKLAVSQYLIPMLQNLSEEKKKIGVYVTSEIAKGFDNYVKNYPNDIDDTATLVPDNPATTNQLYDIFYNKSAGSNSIFDEFYNFIPLLIPEDLMNFILGVALESSDNYIDYAQAGDILSGTDITKDGLYVVNAKENSFKFLDPQIAFRDSFLSMLTRMLFDHNIVKLIHKHFKPLILADGVQPQANQMSAVIQALVSLENELFAHPIFKIFNDAFAVLHNGLYNSISLEFLNNRTFLDLKTGGKPIYDSPAPLTFDPNSKDRFQAVFSKTSILPYLKLDFKTIKQENNILHLGLKDVNELTSLLNSISSLIPKNKAQQDILAIVSNLYQKIDTFAKASVEKHEHLLLNMLLEPASLKDISKYILLFLSKPKNKEVQDKSLIVLELEKYD